MEHRRIRDVAVVLRGRDNVKAFTQALNDWDFGFAVGAPVRPEEQEHGMARVRGERLRVELRRGLAD